MNKSIKEMNIHLHNVLVGIDRFCSVKKNDSNIMYICEKIKKIINCLSMDSIDLIDLEIVKNISNKIYDLNFNNSFSEITDYISNEYYVFEFILQENLK